MKRNANGTFVKGNSYSPATQFQKGKHWRSKKPFWDKDWLVMEYDTKARSSKEIANDFKLNENSILFWLKKHGIARRSMSEIRSKKHWGNEGESNPMFGRIGELNINWKGGITPERQSFYASPEWKEVSKLVWKRDDATCQRCSCKVGRHVKDFAIHHIVSFEVIELRAVLENLVLVCINCHHFIHSNENTNKQFLLTHEQFKSKFE